MLEAKTLLALTLALALSGCTNVPGSDDPTEPLETQDTDLARLNVTLALEAAEIDSGAALNLSLEAMSAAPDVELDLANATWTIEVVAVGDATGADGAPGAGGDGNATTDGNATQEPSNGTVPPNGTAPAAPVASLNGTGLPFVGNLTVDGNGSFQVVATVAAAGFEAATASQDLSVLGVVVEADSCAGFAPQEPFADSGSVLLPGDTSTHEFELLPCHTRMVGSISFSPGSADNDWRLIDPTGRTAASSAAFEVGTEGGLEAKDAAGLPAGTWAVVVENFASVTVGYDFEFTFE